MAMNKAAVRVLDILFAAGYKKDKEIETLELEQILSIDKLNKTDMVEVVKIQKAVKSGRLVEHLSGADEVKPEQPTEEYDNSDGFDGEVI